MTRHTHFESYNHCDSRHYDFYVEVYSSRSPPEWEIEHFLEPLMLPKLTREQRTYMDSDVTMEELREVIAALPTGNAPRPDGHTAEFFMIIVAELA